MNLPPPPPLTAGEMLDNVTRAFMEADDLGEHQARYRAARAIAHLLSVGAYEWWGMSAEGEPLFVEVPIPDQPVVYVVPIIVREE